MTENEIVTIHKWLWFAEVHYDNILVDIQNNFYQHRFHDVNDCIRLLLAEQRAKDFKQFASDLTLLMRTGNFYNNS